MNPEFKNVYPVYSSQTANNGLLGYFHKFLYENAITWTTDGANAGTVNFRPGKFYCTNVCGVLITNKEKASTMFSYALGRITKKNVSYVGNPKLMNNVMAKIEVLYPCNALEQEQISKLFENIDTLITLHQRKCEIWIIFSKTDRILIRGFEMDYKNLVKEYREQQLLTQVELAKKLNVGIADISRWENGKYEPTMKIKRVLKSLFIESGLIKGETNNE